MRIEARSSPIYDDALDDDGITLFSCAYRTRYCCLRIRLLPDAHAFFMTRADARTCGVLRLARSFLIGFDDAAERRIILNVAAVEKKSRMPLVLLYLR